MLKPFAKTALACAVLTLSAAGTHAEDNDRDFKRNMSHVLLLSIDGMHALDLENCTRNGTCTNLAALAGGGVTYTRTSTSMPSDSYDYYSPEVNSTVIALPRLVTPTGVSCGTIRDTTQVGSWTDSFQNIQCHDSLKVNAILNQINGYTHNGSQRAPVPTLFGMNFQAVSVGQKLIENGSLVGGYTDALGTPTALMQNEITFVDAGIGKMIAGLKARGILDDTLVIVTAKHGQSPMDPARFFPIPGKSGNNGTSPANLLAAYLPYSESPQNPTGIGPTEDDISQIWLVNPSETANAVQVLQANANAAGVGQIFYGASLETMFNKPGLPPNGDPRTPDIIVQPRHGVVYTGSAKKQAEHGGFSHDDANVMLLVANPHLKPHQVTTAVETTQVAPTILKSLGLDPQQLDAVRIEGTRALPDLY